MVNIYFKTFGCPTNFSESESMKGILKKNKFNLVDTIKEAFVIVLNICTVKGNISPLREIRKINEEFPNKKIIIAGCITKDIIPEIRKITKEASILNTHNIKDIVQVVEETINDNPIQHLVIPEIQEEKVSLPKLKNNKSIGIIPICSGCTGICSYCSVRIIKGKLFSYSEKKIIEEVQKNVTQGAKQIWITAQDTASYMLDKESKTKLPDLIKKIIKIPGNYKIRIGMMNADNLIPVIDEMIEVFQNEKVFKFLHLPIQSGSDEVLKKMKRKYTIKEFKEVIKKIRENVPNITIATDMICGFPGETKLNFQESIKLVDEIQPNILNVSKFRIRPGTESALMEDQIPGDQAKQRTKNILSLFEWTAFRKNKKWLNWAGEVIIEEKGKEGTNTFIGRNFAYKPIIIEGNFSPGDFVKVKIDAFTKHYLRGKLI